MSPSPPALRPRPRPRPGRLALAVLLGFSPLLRAQFPDDPVVLYTHVCAACHGDRGEGRRELSAPSIGGLPDWYVELQLEKFRRGHRGFPEDPAAAAMRAMALALPPPSVPALARYVASLEKHPTRSEPPRNPARVARFYVESCAPCHRFNGHGERVFQSAPITLLPSWYVRETLRKFRDGQRGNHPHDEQGAKMREVTEHLSDESIDELARYVAVLAETYPPGQRRQRIRSPTPEIPPGENPFHPGPVDGSTPSDGPATPP